MDKHPPIFWTSMAVFATPIIPAAIAAIRLVRNRETRNFSTLLPLSIVVASFLFMFSGGLHPAIWGPDYSNLRFRVIGGNFILSLAAALLAVTARPKLHMWTLASSLMLSAVWAFVYAINSVV